MKREFVESIVDKTIIKSLEDKSNILETIYDLKIRSTNIFKVLDKENIDLSPLLPVIISGNQEEINKINVSKRALYAYYYVDHASKRIEDLKWMFDKKDKFKRYTPVQLFSLINFKNKISKEKSLYLPF